jgi:hypothetical protein
MRFNTMMTVVGPVAVVLAATSLATAADIGPLAADARRAGLRVIEGRHLLLATDRPARDGDGVESLPRIFDEAFVAWCRHFAIDPEDHHAWKVFGCLVVDRERFREAGLLPDAVPDFANGFCDRNRFWMKDQSNPAYRRHLLLHEGVHAFTITLRDLDTPAWYAEGIAELLATHRLEPMADGPSRFVATPIPPAAEDVPQLGRIEAIRRLRSAGDMPSLDEVFSLPGTAHGEIRTYASSWAAVAMLALHPRHAARLVATEQGPLDARFTERLVGSNGWDAAVAARDFDAFTDDLDYGYDLARSAIDWSMGPRLESPTTLAVAADRGWQNGGLTVARGRRYAFRGRGRVAVGHASGMVLESEPAGISIDWYRGRPLGRLLVAEWVALEDGPRPGFAVVAEGAEGDFEARADGPLFFKVNESSGGLADNQGIFQVTVQPK